MTVAQKLDLSKMRSGTYTGAAEGFRGRVAVSVVIKDGKIESARVTETREDMPFTSLTDVPKQIVAKQSILGVDTVTNATMHVRTSTARRTLVR